MPTALTFPSITGVTGAPNMPNLTEVADIQSALKYLYFGSTGAASTSAGIYGALHRLYVGDPTLAGNVTINGDLTVSGTTTTLDVANLLVEDKEIVIGNVASPSNTTANGGGIRLEAGAGVDKTIIWDSTNANWTTSENWNLAAGKALRIGAGGSTTNVISGTAAALVIGENATTSLTIGPTSTASLTIGAGPSTGTVTHNYSSGLGSTATQTINLGSSNIGTATRNINIGVGSITTATQTISIGTGAWNASGGHNISIGSSTSTNTISGTTIMSQDAPITKTVNFTVGANEKNYVIGSGAASPVQVTLPTATAGRTIGIINKSSQPVTSSATNVYPRTTSTLGTAILSGTAGAWATLVADGTNWWIMAGN